MANLLEDFSSRLRKTRTRVQRVAAYALSVVLMAAAYSTPSADAQSYLGNRQRALQDDDASRMLDLARDHLAGRNPRLACAQLAILIDRYSGSPAANEARQTLSSLETSNACGPQAANRESTTRGEEPSPWRTTSQEASTGTSSQLMLAPSRLSSRMEQGFRESTGDRVFFAPSSAELGAKARSVLASQAQWLKRYPSFFITLEAHADDPGSTSFNAELSARRAENVRLRLVEEGVDAARIVINARGREARVALCSEPACLAQNRRVVTRLVDHGSPSGAEPPRRPVLDVTPTAHGLRN